MTMVSQPVSGVGMNSEGNSSFSSLLPTLQIAWDSTSMGTFKECARKYYYSLIHGAAPRIESVHLTFGLLYHKALEIYDHAKTQGLSHEDALDETIKYCLEATWDKEKKRPWASDHTSKNRETLIRTVVWYLDQFEDDPIKTVILDNGRPAVELSFRLETDYISMGTGERFIICGHLDRIGTFGDETFILDRKTTSSTISSDFFAKFSPDNQFSTYVFAGQLVWKLPINAIIVDAAQIAVSFSRFERGVIARKPDQLEEWYKDLGYYLKMAEYYAKENYWPQNDKSCGNYGGCPFRPICAKSPKTREEWLSNGYVSRQWDPLKIRGDI